MLVRAAKKRIKILVATLSLLILIAIFSLVVLRDNILYFLSPTEIKNSENLDYSKKIRVGGMVKTGSVSINNNEINFIITDLSNEIFVTFKGTVPNLFSEGKGVVAEGKLKDKKFFIAKRILAKHDENYMPPSAEKILNKDAK
tara:strand:- start:746 stop:1174 length:429 start_codon:yes stop_codon:yes gene_type:complete